MMSAAAVLVGWTGVCASGSAIAAPPSWLGQPRHRRRQLADVQLAVATGALLGSRAVPASGRPRRTVALCRRRDGTHDPGAGERGPSELIAEMDAAIRRCRPSQGARRSQGDGVQLGVAVTAVNVLDTWLVDPQMVTIPITGEPTVWVLRAIAVPLRRARGGPCGTPADNLDPQGPAPLQVGAGRRVAVLRFPS